jgi:hypothetical protein
LALQRLLLLLLPPLSLLCSVKWTQVLLPWPA